MFKLYSSTVTKESPIEYISVTENEEIQMGESLKLVNGKLTKASGTDIAEFVSVGKREAKTNDVAPVVRLLETDIYETQLSDTPAEGVTLNAGDKVTISSDGLNVTATKTNGVLTLTDVFGTEVGSTVRGMFRR